MNSLSNLQRLIYAKLQTNTRKAMINKKRFYYVPRYELVKRIAREFNLTENQAYSELESIGYYFRN